ncbi:MAG: hypothetical protein CEN90_153 [Parcubacteria group bacterium Licking1014_17]|nr:MAG: hypothetical protein CEN90_153 [Parcubacteria group bacterium Licking1014_17]
MIRIIEDGDVSASVSSIGATVGSFSIHGKNIIYSKMTVGQKSRGGIPICFPFFGTPPEDFNAIPKHGWLRNQDFDLVEHSGDCIVFRGANEKMPGFPWLLEYRVTIRVRFYGSLILGLVAKRLKDGEFLHAPINPGFHPYFCADRSDEYMTRGIARVGSRVITDFCGKSSRIIADEPILVRSGEHKLKMILGGDFGPKSYLTLWSDNPDEYFCVEPTLTDPDVFTDSEYGRFLKEGEQLEMECCLTVV